ncbi:hydrogenase maturation nickel metallochaperone HypA [Daejeonia sp. YH14]|uniref:hydrogenase maturation nickel metallochaperone HypA/HybF n=1 Tax=Daejeonia sp. YH14 TaxID=3439042 RepID=UPI003F4950FB
MHELSIATSILKTSENEVRKINGLQVAEIYLEIGKISGIEIASLEFVWDQCMKDTVLENARRHIQETGGLAKCAECGMQFPIEKIFDPCPGCGSPFKEILKGKEMKIKKLLITT